MDFKLSHKIAQGMEVPYAEVLASKARGRVAESKVAPEKCQWRFSYGIRIDGVMNGASFMEMLRSGNRPSQPPKLTPEKATDDQLSRISGALICSTGKKEWYSKTRIPGKDIPGLREHILQGITERDAADKAEKSRRKALTPAQRKAEEKDLIDQFLAGGGTIISAAGIRTR